MRVSRTPVALAVLLFVTACGSSAELLAPAGTSASTAAGEERDGIGMIGSGNNDSTETEDPTTTERGGAGLMGSGN